MRYMKKSIYLLSLLIIVSCNKQSNYLDLFHSAKEKSDDGKYSEAINILDDAIRLKPDFDSAYVEIAYNYLKIEKPESALLNANKAIELKHNNMSAYFVRGLIYYFSNEIDKALKDFTYIIERKDSNYMNLALRERAKIYLNTNETDNAIRDFSEILESDSLNYETYVSRGLAKLRIDVYPKYADSIIMAQNDTKLYNKFFKYFRIIYSIDENRNIMLDKRGAIQDFNKALRINPEYDYAYFNRARVYEELDLYYLALADMNKAIELNKNSDYYVTRAKIYNLLEENMKSLNDFNEAIRLDPKNGFAYLNRGILKREHLKDEKGAETDKKMAENLGVKSYY